MFRVSFQLALTVALVEIYESIAGGYHVISQTLHLYGMLTYNATCYASIYELEMSYVIVIVGRLETDLHID